MLRLIEPINVEVSKLRVEGLTQDESIGALEANADRLESVMISAGSSAPVCSVCTLGAQSSSVWVSFY